MTALSNRMWLLDRRPTGVPSERDFRRAEAPVPTLRKGQFLVRNLYFAFEPAMRVWMTEARSYTTPVELGAVMRSACVGEVVGSRHPEYGPGDLVHGWFGWQDYAVGPGAGMDLVKLAPGASPVVALGVMGLTGLTAYFGLLDIGRPKRGQTVVVSGAAGATGSVAAQIARLKGCRVIGVAGGPEKCAWLRESLGLDAAIDYREGDIARKLAALCPQGIDVFFDNVGGAVLDAALGNLALNARVVLCGAISQYNAEEPTPGPANYFQLAMRRARMEGFIVTDYAARFGEARAALANWVGLGKIRHRADVQEGFDEAPRTLLRLFTGQNDGKQLLRVNDRLPEAEP